jgi:hypothetical protein
MIEIELSPLKYGVKTYDNCIVVNERFFGEGSGSPMYESALLMCCKAIVAEHFDSGAVKMCLYTGWNHNLETIERVMSFINSLTQICVYDESDIYSMIRAGLIMDCKCKGRLSKC